MILIHFCCSLTVKLFVVGSVSAVVKGSHPSRHSHYKMVRKSLLEHIRDTQCCSDAGLVFEFVFVNWEH